jgi:hypothetical protein
LLETGIRRRGQIDQTLAAGGNLRNTRTGEQPGSGEQQGQNKAHEPNPKEERTSAKKYGTAADGRPDAAPASALTLIQLSGTGAIAIDSTGSIDIDTGGNVFDQITLGADQILIPGEGPSVPDSVVSLSGLVDYTASFDEDIWIEIVAWSGTLSAHAATSLSVSGPLLSVDPGDPCELATGIIVGTGTPPPGESCAVELQAGTGVFFSDGVGQLVLRPGGAIPEPGAALLFTIGLVLIRNRKRA